MLDYDGGVNAWEVWNDASIEDFAIAMTDHDGDYYSVDFPSQVVTAGVYRVTVFKQVGGVPHADNDKAIGEGEIYWDGSAEVDLFTVNTTIVDDVVGADGDSLNDISDQLDVMSEERNRLLNVYGEGE